MIFLSMARIAVVALAAIGVSADDDPIAEKLNAAKDAYQEAIENAKGKLLDAIAKQKEKVNANTRQNVNVRLKIVNELAEEEKAFRDDGTLPTSGSMKSAVTSYKRIVDRARDQCDSAFEKAKADYGANRDLIAAGAVDNEKKRFFQPPVDRRVDMLLERFHVGCSGIWVASSS